MSEFKQDMLKAADAYQQQRYDGDLAADVMKRRRRVWPWVAAAAAVVVLVLLNSSPETPAPRPQVVKQDTKPIEPSEAPIPERRVSKPGLTDVPSMAKVKRRIRMTAHMPKLRFRSVPVTGHKHRTQKKERSNEVDEPKKPDGSDGADRGAGSGDVYRPGAGVCA